MRTNIRIVKGFKKSIIVHGVKKGGGRQENETLRIRRAEGGKTERLPNQWSFLVKAPKRTIDEL